MAARNTTEQGGDEMFDGHQLWFSFFISLSPGKPCWAPCVRLDPFDARGADNQQGADPRGTEGKGGGEGGGGGEGEWRERGVGARTVELVYEIPLEST